jgi:hypothetical protein
MRKACHDLSQAVQANQSKLKIHYWLAEHMFVLRTLPATRIQTRNTSGPLEADGIGCIFHPQQQTGTTLPQTHERSPLRPLWRRPLVLSPRDVISHSSLYLPPPLVQVLVRRVTLGEPEQAVFLQKPRPTPSVNQFKGRKHPNTYEIWRGGAVSVPAQT